MDGGAGDTVALGQLAETLTLRSIPQDGSTIEIEGLASDVAALELGAAHAGAHPLDDQVAFELGDGADDSLADIVLYTSPAKGFIDQADFLHLGQLSRALSPVHDADNGLRFANFFLVATHADPSISDHDLARIVERGAQRLDKQFGESLFLEEPRKLSVEEIQHRIFTFWFENKGRRQQLESNLLKTLSSVMPNVIRQQIDSEVKQIKARTRCLVPAFDGAFLSGGWKEALWARFYTEAPPRQRRSVERYNIVKRA